jgi:hypothetical protein
MATLKDLIKAGFLVPGDELIWVRKQTGAKSSVFVQSNGTLKAEDGTTFKTPSSAAKAMNNDIAINGWRVWRLHGNSQSLLEIRASLGLKISTRKVVKSTGVENPISGEKTPEF